MTASELSRKLLYCGYSDVTDYLKNSPVNRYIYRELLTIMPEHQIELPMVKMFQEIYYQVIRIPYDRHPGENLQKRYIEDSVSWLESHGGTELVFCIVVTILRRKVELTFQEDCFLQQIAPFLDGSVFLSFGNDLNNFMEKNDIQYVSYIPLMPCSIKEIPLNLDSDVMGKPSSFAAKMLTTLVSVSSLYVFEENPWQELTDDFSYNVMEWYIKLYTTIEDQQELLNRIERACSDNNYKKHRNDFNQLREQITEGKLLATDFEMQVQEIGGVKTFTYRRKPRFESNDESERVFNEEYAMAAEAFEEGCTEYYKELANRYKVEIEGLKKQLEQQYLVKTEWYKTESTTKEFMLSVSEMVDIVKERFSKTGADEFCGMLSKLAVKHGRMEEGLWELIDGIVPAVLNRETRHQIVEIPSAAQVNINPKEVNNHVKEVNHEREEK